MVGYGHSGGATSVTVGARAGFNAAITERVSFWPTAGLDGGYNSRSGFKNATAKLVVLAPFLYHVAPHFFVGAGPFLNYLFEGGPDTEYGLDFVIGGWF